MDCSLDKCPECQGDIHWITVGQDDFIGRIRVLGCDCGWTDEWDGED